MDKNGKRKRGERAPGLSPELNGPAACPRERNKPGPSTSRAGAARKKKNEKRGLATDHAGPLAAAVTKPEEKDAAAGLELETSWQLHTHPHHWATDRIHNNYAN